MIVTKVILETVTQFREEYTGCARACRGEITNRPRMGKVGTLRIPHANEVHADEGTGRFGNKWASVEILKMNVLFMTCAINLNV